MTSETAAGAFRRQGRGVSKISDVDQARLLPRYRVNQPQPIIAPDSGTIHVPTFNAAGQPRARTNDGLMVDPRDLRGIPVVGVNVGGVSPGTQPERALIAKATRNERMTA